MNLDRRLRALGRQFGCRIHGVVLQCAACQPDEPLPPELTAALSSLIDTLIARLGKDESRARILSVSPPPPQAVCPWCAGRRKCSACEVSYARAVFWATGPTVAEQAQMDAFLDLARELDAQRAG